MKKNISSILFNHDFVSLIPFRSDPIGIFAEAFNAAIYILKGENLGR